MVRQSSEDLVDNESPPVGRRSRLRAIAVAARPRQWLKNLLVFAAPAAAAVVGRPVTFGRTAGAMLAFCVASSGVYFVNDALDAASDRLHPKKRFRPVAAGDLTPRFALRFGLALIVVAIVACIPLGGLPLAGILLAYGMVSLAYSMQLKQVPVLELLCVSAGFILRAMAGGVAARVPLSPWFIVVACFGSLFVVLGKRTAEFSELGTVRAVHRRALGWYRFAWLNTARWLSELTTVGAYLAWAVARSTTLTERVNGVLILLSVIPFALVVLLVERAITKGRGGAPEELALRDRALQAVGVAWGVLVLAALLQ